jgi:uncharacterized membrane protein YdjX (TVP38/TMEM64 family)
VNRAPDSPVVHGRSQTRARWLIACIAVGITALATVLWRFTPLAEWADAQRIAAWIGDLRDAGWTPIAVIAAYVLGGLVIFPVTLMIAVTAVIFTPLLALGLSFAGVLASAATTYFIGARLVRSTMHAAFGRTVRKVSDALSDRGVVAIAVIRMIPIAPFTIVNLAAGSIGLRMRDYLIGTALGIAPGIAALTAFGNQIRRIIEHPTMTNVAILVAVIGGWIGVSLLLQMMVSRWRRKDVRT